MAGACQAVHSSGSHPMYFTCYSQLQMVQVGAVAKVVHGVGDHQWSA
jgi:hypothetical protein